MYRTVFWTLWERARVGWFERITLKHVYYHMWNRSPVQVQCMRQGAQGWCTEMTLRDGMGRKVRGAFRMGEHMYTHGWFMSMYGKNRLLLGRKVITNLDGIFKSRDITLPQGWKRSVFVPIPKKGNAKECSNYCTIAIISPSSKVMLKILQVRLSDTWTTNFQMFVSVTTPSEFVKLPFSQGD